MGEKITTNQLKSNNGFTIFGMPVYLFVIFAVIMVASIFTETLGTGMASSFALLYFLGIIFNEVGERVPLWNTYIGGGPILAFIGTAYLVYAGILPAKYVESATVFMDDVDFLTLFVVVLITGSVLSVDRKLLVRSFLGYIPAILGGVLFAMIFGIVAGLFMGIAPVEVAIKYVLPIMGGGNGAGAVPLSEIWEATTGQPKGEYYSFAISILTIGNIFAIIAAALLNKLGKAKPALTGDKTNLMRKSAELDAEDKVDYKPNLREIANGLVLAGMFYALGSLFSGYILPSIGGVVIHKFAYMIIFVVLANAFNLIPENLKVGAKKLQTFFTKQFLLVMMAGVGIAFTDLGEIIAAITLQNVVVAVFIIIGAVVGSGLVGHLVGFFFVDSSVTAGLCMANRGGSGDIQVLGAADRMELMPYAQISSRLGGGLVLVIGSVLFGLFM
ncbi:2-hydroxycarboxylate transporter family protein [Irregularibacter muris]|uniref:2-hydroxycarboxylate transporter family protein n=1 Tax=Irregularibacter muris TaxID=1796619 RepID=A0AAE3L2M1_9FIRM|nr:2-hydroxycarboxylate transporter family protein [Irregularibacter muris]MCR1898829.1 2-hydroxycarboxylate transporter family protein [Irregularibacter muris]